ncbi:hypothetical protein SDC9_17010 [bioreactor metagenome]|uniref:Teichoic acid poly(glycerol phosphate) polymerase n=2 Tax=root TaxID=1 RepID=A0A644TW75_9ZZZZ
MIFMKTELIIKECIVKSNNLYINVNCDIDYDPDVFEPKLKINFFNGKNNLILPVLITNRRYISFKNLDSLEFSQKFEINDIFLDKKWKEIKFYLSLHYGNHIVTDFSFDLDNDINNDFVSKYLIENDENQIKLIKINDKNNLNILRHVLSLFIRIIALIISIFLIPFFIFESIFIMIKTPDLNSSGGDLYLEDKNVIKRGIRHILWRISSFSNFPVEKLFINFKNYMLNKIYQLAVLIYQKENTVMFISERGQNLTGNLKFVYDYIKNNENTKNVNIKVSTINQSFPITSFSHKWNTYKDMASSNVILLDNYFSPVNILNFNNQTLIQLWHAAGAFKTFGFTRFGRPGGPKLDSKNHRKYDMATVSSRAVIECYSEAYGVSSDKILPLGIPRTDIFFDTDYIDSTKENFYKKYPQLKDKKIILFGPTFRGTNRRNGYYPIKKFDPIKIYNDLNQEYAIIIKRHFFINNKFKIPNEYSDYILDLDINEDINDLLFVTDILITDYSSTVFEASLLDVPMIFYAFDLDDYISNRSFYFEYKSFVPGKITYTQDELINSIKNNDFEDYKIKDFKDKFFEEIDGKSTERIINYICNVLEKNKKK